VLSFRKLAVTFQCRWENCILLHSVCYFFKLRSTVPTLTVEFAVVIFESPYALPHVSLAHIYCTKSISYKLSNYFRELTLEVVEIVKLPSTEVVEVLE